MDKVKVYLTVLSLVFISGCDFLFSDIDEIGYKVDIEIVGEGSVIIEPDKNLYVEGEEITLESVVANDWIFYDWNGDVNGYSSKVSVTVDKDINVVANFSKATQIYEYNFSDNSSRNYTQSEPGGFLFQWDALEDFFFDQDFKIQMTFDVIDLYRNDPFLPIIFNYFDENNLSLLAVSEDYIFIDERENGSWNPKLDVNLTDQNLDFQYLKGSKYKFEFIKTNSVYTLKMSINSNNPFTLFRTNLDNPIQSFTNGIGFGVSGMSIYFNHVKAYQINSTSNKILNSATTIEGSGLVVNEKYFLNETN